MSNDINESVQYYEDAESNINYQQQYDESLPQALQISIDDVIMQSIGAIAVNPNVTETVNLQTAQSIISDVTAPSPVTNLNANPFTKLFDSFKKQSQQDKNVVSALFVAIIALYLISK